jgi:hypothetical protein
MNQISPSSPPISPVDDRWRTVSGPVAVLATFASALVISSVFGAGVGDVSCAWNLSFSPSGRAFGIWAVIYFAMIASISVQLVDGFGPVTYAAEPQTNYLIAWSWMLCGLWSIAFTSASSRDSRAGIGLAAFTLLSAMLSALGAVAIEASWRTNNAWRICAVGVPYSIFAGWLTMACVLNVSIVVKSTFYPPDYECYTATRVRRRYSTFVLADPIDIHSCTSYVPLAATTFISIYACFIPDPVLPLPVAWAIFNMKGHLKNWIALGLVVVTSVACVIASVV